MPPQTTSRPPSGGGPVGIRHPEPADGKAMWSLARRSGLDLNSPYAYVLWGDHFAATSLVAEGADGALVGFVTGFRAPSEPQTVFVWQIAVDGAHRGQGIAGLLLHELVARTEAGLIEATVTPGNTASAAMFRALAARHGATAQEALAYPEGLFPEGHEPEIRFRVPVRSPVTPTDPRRD